MCREHRESEGGTREKIRSWQTGFARLKIDCRCEIYLSYDCEQFDLRFERNFKAAPPSPPPPPLLSFPRSSRKTSWKT